MNHLKRSLALILAFIICLGVISMLSACETVGTAYYISADGNDENDGLSERSAWKSFKNVKNLVLGEGDRLLLRRGDVWNERLTVRASGTREHPAKIASYGDKNKAKPMIKLNCDRDDICLLLTDVVYGAEKKCVDIKNVIIEDIAVSNSNLGIYVRPLLATDNGGIVIRNIEAYDMICDSELTRMGHGFTVDEFVAMKKEPKGNLPCLDNTSNLQETGGGAGEYMYSIAIRFGTAKNRNYCTGVEVYDNVMYNCITGIEFYCVNDSKVHDNIVSGSYAGVVRESLCNRAEVYHNRIVGGSELYTFFGGTCGGYAAICEDINVHDNEFAYEYNMGENDGTGFDYEAYCKNATLNNNIFHHNDAGGILIMANENTQHENVVLDGNLFYGDIRNPKDSGYVYEILFINKGENNIFFRNMELYTRKRAENLKTKTKYYGCLAVKGYGGTVIEDSNKTLLDTDYRSRFSFNVKNEGFTVNGGSLEIANGAATLKAENGTGSMILGIPQNGYCCNDFRFTVANDAKGEAYLQYETSDGVKTSKKVKIGGAGEYVIPVSDDAVKGIMRNIVFVWKASAKDGEITLGKAWFTPDITVTAKKTGSDTVLLTFGGKCFPMLALSPKASDILINGVSAATVERTGYNGLIVKTGGTLGGSINITVKGDLFLEYYAAMINGLDVDRTPADDAAVLKCAAEDYPFGTVSFENVKI